MRLIKAVSVACVFGIAFLSIPSASAADPIATSRIVTGGGTGLFFEFTTSALPNDIITNNNITVTPSGNGQLCSYLSTNIPCGNFHPNIRVCNMDNSLSSPTVSIHCYNPQLIFKVSDNNFQSASLSVASITSTTTAYFDDNFNVVPTNGSYYAIPVEVSNANSPCIATPNNCTYWLEYYNGSTANNSNGYVDYVATGTYTNILQNAFWTPSNSNSNGGGSTNGDTSCTSPSSCYNSFKNIIDNSIIGQAKTIYTDFFSFQYKVNDVTYKWRDVNPTTSDCSYPNITGEIGLDRLPTGFTAPFYNANGLVPPTAKCCVGAVIKLPGLNGVSNNPIYSSTYKAQFPQEKYATPFYACGNQAQYISTTYILPIENALVYIGFAFLMARLLLDIFGLGSNSDVVGSSTASSYQVKGYLRNRKYNKNKGGNK